MLAFGRGEARGGLMRIVVLLLVWGMTAALALAAPALARDEPVSVAQTYAEVVSVYDGDTFSVTALIWLDQTIDTKVRLAHVDTPELHSACKAEQARALKARDYVRGLMKAGTRVTLTGIKADKYAGRIVAGVRLPDGRDLAGLLLDKRLARKYEGGRKLKWC